MNRQESYLIFQLKEVHEAYNHRQNLWNNGKKSSKIGQDEETLVSIFA